MRLDQSRASENVWWIITAGSPLFVPVVSRKVPEALLGNFKMEDGFVVGADNSTPNQHTLRTLSLNTLRKVFTIGPNITYPANLTGFL